MSNGKDEGDLNFVPEDPASIPFYSFKTRHKRVRKVLQGIDDSKSANGIGPKFWKAAATPVKLYKYHSLWPNCTNEWYEKAYIPPDGRSHELCLHTKEDL